MPGDGGRSAMKLFLAIRHGNDESPDGPNGEDTLFLVRAVDRDGAAFVVDTYLVTNMTHKKVEPLCHRMVELGEDLSANRSPEILYGPWYGLGATKKGYRNWAREGHTDYLWVDVDRWYATE